MTGRSHTAEKPSSASRLACHEPSSPCSLELGPLPSISWPTHLPIWHAAVATEVQGPWHSGSGCHREGAVLAGCQAEGQAGPAAQEDVDSGERQGTQYEEQKAALEETVVVGLGVPPSVESKLLQGCLSLGP